MGTLLLWQVTTKTGDNMDTSLTMVAATAIGKMLIMVIVGFAGVKLGILGETETSAITKTVLNVTCPMLILASYMQPFDPAKAKGLLLALALGVLIHVVGIVLGMLVIRKNGNPDWQIERMAVSLANKGFSLDFSFKTARLVLAILFNFNSFSYFFRILPCAFPKKHLHSVGFVV